MNPTLRRAASLRFLWQDAVVLAALIALASVADWDFLSTGDYLPLPWGDWIAHAYRIRFLQEHGFATWDHNWDGGLSLFQDYQFVPHVVTAIVAELLGASPGRTMLFLEGLLLIWVRASGYVTARVLGLPPAAALLAGAVTFGAADYAGEVLSFSSLWGLALVAPLLMLAFRYGEKPAIYLVAVTAGLCIYVHPHLFLSGVAGLVAAFLAQPITGRRVRRLAVQVFLVSLATAFSWAPALFSAKPPIQDPTSSDVVFLRGIFSGGVDHMSDVIWVLLPVIGVTIVVCWKWVRYYAIRFVSVFVGLVLVLIGLSYSGAGPEPVRLLQSVRMLSVLSLPIGLYAALAADAAMRGASERSVVWRHAAIAVVVVAALALAVPFVRFASDQPYRPAWWPPDPVSVWLTEHEGEITGRVWFDDLGVPWYTFGHFDKVQSSMDHFPVGEWSLLARPQQEGILLTEIDMATTEEYLKAAAVSHLVMSEETAFAIKLAQQESSDGEYREVARFPGDPAPVIWQVPWTPVRAFVAEADTLPDIQVPSTKYVGAEERSARDRLVRQYSEFAYSAAATHVPVEYPSSTTMRVPLTDISRGQYLVIGENWDRTWHASAGGKPLDVDRYGPNYLRVDVSGLQGDFVVELSHGMSLDWKIGIALTLLSVPAAIAAMLSERRGRL